MAGGAFLQPFVPGAVPLPHGVAQGVHPQSAFLPTTTEEERIFSHLGTSGEKNTSVSEHQISEPSFTISLPTSVTNSRGNPHVTPNPMFPNYFSSIYAPMPDIGVNYTYTRSDPGVGGSPQAGSQPLRFHPGTSVSLKDGQFNLVRGSEPSP
uniref:Uncharacterized protein n=1 Tax=Ciona savignyi TaxID=51511 RepID=H2ZLC4_CIOSA